MDGIYGWAVFSQEKQYDFNSLYLTLGDEAVLVDPVPFTEEDAAEMEKLGKPSTILITNKDHRRAAPEARKRFGARILVHAADAAELGCEADGTFVHGDLLFGSVLVVHVPDAKSPGESALWLASRRILIVGDALIGRPEGRLSLLPDLKYKDPAAARRGAARLAGLDAEIVLVGDGTPILSNGRAALEAFARRFGVLPAPPPGPAGSPPPGC
ncbi:MAG: MBL fold metallo-hydrolase [Myxococcales bacterium]|nr:MBL fold metallo-hydrolase [Myxococcales bacterium]